MSLSHVSHNWLHHLDACAGSVLTPHHYITNVQKRLASRVGLALANAGCVDHLDSQLEHGETCSTAEATRGRYAYVHAVLAGLKLADPGITTEPRGHTETQSRSSDLFATAVPGRSAALDVCVASSNAAAARRDAAQALFDRKLSHYRQQIPDIRGEGILYRLLVWTADARPHPAVTRTLQCAAACSRHRSMPQRSTNVGKTPFDTDGSTKSK